MYLGCIVEYTDKRMRFTRPLHTYAESLLLAVPVPNPKVKWQKRVLQGDVPSRLSRRPAATSTPGRPYVVDRCKVESPNLRDVKPGQWVSS